MARPGLLLNKLGKYNEKNVKAENKDPLFVLFGYPFGIRLWQRHCPTNLVDWGPSLCAVGIVLNVDIGHESGDTESGITRFNDCAWPEGREDVFSGAEARRCLGALSNHCLKDQK